MYMYIQMYVMYDICVKCEKYMVYKIYTNRSKYIQGKSEGFDSCERPSNLTQIGFKSSIF